MRLFLLHLFAQAAVAGGALDGAIAPPGRWIDARGAPSGSRASEAMPVERDVEEAWSLALPAPALAPPVLWDGTLFLLCGDGRAAQIVAVDLGSGALLSKQAAPESPRRYLCVWNGTVLLPKRDHALAGVRFNQNAFVRAFEFDAGGPVDEPVFYEGEIYAVANGALARIHPGLLKPLWTGRRGARGKPAIQGAFVHVLEARDDERMLALYDRASGSLAKVFPIGATRPAADRGGADGVAVRGDAALVASSAPFRTEGGSQSHAFVRLDRNEARGLDGFWSFGLPPAVHRTGFLGYGRGDKEPAWEVWEERGGRVLARASTHPWLFRSAVAPAVLGDVAYFGTWAADLETGEILWKLPIEEVRFPPTPADRLVVVVDGNDALRAYRGRGAR